MRLELNLFFFSLCKEKGIVKLSRGNSSARGLQETVVMLTRLSTSLLCALRRAYLSFFFHVVDRLQFDRVGPIDMLACQKGHASIPRKRDLEDYCSYCT